MREIKEELGENFKIKVGNIFDTTFRVFKKPKNPLIEQVFIVFYLCEYVSGEIIMQPEEVLETAWVDKNDFLNYQYIPAYIPILKKYFENF